MTLKQQLDAFAANFAAQMPADIVNALQQSIDELRYSGLVERAARVGDLAPEFSLPNAMGRQIALHDLLQRGLLILKFYRGGWCPYCNLELRAYQKVLPEIRSLGADLLAISPQTPDHSLSAAEKNALAFEVLSDRRNAIAAQFGLAVAIPEVVKNLSERFGNHFPEINGSDDWQLPLPATYVIAQDRSIVFANVGPDFRVRAEPTEVLSAVRAYAAARRVA